MSATTAGKPMKARDRSAARNGSAGVEGPASRSSVTGAARPSRRSASSVLSRRLRRRG
jgi:hypothetical protein